VEETSAESAVQTPVAPSRPRPRAGRSAVVLVVLLAAGCSQLSGTQTAPPRTRSTTIGAAGQPAPGGAVQLLGVSCATALACWAVGSAPALSPLPRSGAQPSVIDATVDGGASWRAQRAELAGPSVLAGISCPDRLHCLAVGATLGDQVRGAVVGTADGGAHWAEVGAPSSAIDVVSVHCAVAGRCIVLATDGSSLWSATTNDGGRVFQRGGALPTGFSGAGRLDCPDPTECEVAGFVPSTPGHGTGAIATTSDGGTTWAAATLPGGLGILHSVSCLVDHKCLAVGTSSTTASGVAVGQGELLTSSDRTNWAPAAAPAGVHDAFGVSCPSDLVCALVGTRWTTGPPVTPTAGVTTSTDGGKTWRQATTVYTPVGLSAIDCPSTRSCISVGGDVLVRVALPRAHRR
jgi:photosystem II stability/assembly factor-like uncharacterized protein